MPVQTPAVSIRCDICGISKQRKDMSVFNGICLICFEYHYILCARCGCIIRRNNRRSSGQGCLARISYTLLGDIVCADCHHYNSPNRRRPGDFWTWHSKPLNNSIATYQRIGSKRKFGVEIETSNCAEHNGLHNNTNFGSKFDCTVSGMEFDSPILYGDEGLECIVNFLKYADHNNWYADEDCGCHVHFDMRDEHTENLWNIIYAYTKTYKMWAACVPLERRNNTHCHQPSFYCADIRYCHRDAALADFERFAYDCDRYDFLNTQAYFNHKTFELRLLEGTLNAVDICNWITIHTRFIDCVRTMSFDDIDHYFGDKHRIQFSTLTSIIKNKSLINWLATRARRLGKAPLRGPGSKANIRFE